MVEPVSVSPPQTLPQAAAPEQPQVVSPSAPAVSVAGSPAATNTVAAAVAPTVGEEEFAGFGARFLASVVDGMIAGAIYFVLMITVFILIGVTAAGLGRREPGAGILISMLLFQGIGMILAFGYYIYFTAKGQTLGKKVLKIRVVRVENGEPPGYTKAFLREVVGKMVSAMVFGLGYLWMLWDGKKQTWHDKIAGTIVVKS